MSTKHFLTCQHDEKQACAPCMIGWYYQNKTYLDQMATLVTFFEEQLKLKEEKKEE